MTKPLANRSLLTPGPGKRFLSLSFLQQRFITSKNPKEADGLTSAQRELVAHWSAHPWNYLTGKDTDGRPIYFTRDEKDSRAPLKPFPEFEYLQAYIEVLHQRRAICVDKARQMYMSTATLGYLDWQCSFLPGRRWILSKSKEDEATEMLQDKIIAPHAEMPDWLQKWNPVKMRNTTRLVYKRTKSYILAATQNVAERSGRGGTASGVLIDEAAFQDQFESIWSACEPMAGKLIAITTANLGNPGAEAFKHLIKDDLEGEAGFTQAEAAE